MAKNFGWGKTSDIFKIAKPRNWARLLCGKNQLPTATCQEPSNRSCSVQSAGWFADDHHFRWALAVFLCHVEPRLSVPCATVDPEKRIVCRFCPQEIKLFKTSAFGKW